jgi:processive 1,2-diacylglycerol beta-glucosyltransferase
MYISEVSGHHNATIAIENALRILDPRTEILNINSFNYTNPIWEKLINKAYMGVIKKTPHVWDFLYDNPSVVKKIQGLKEAIHKANFRKLKILFDEFKPDAVVCTQAFPCGMVADYKKTFNLKLPLFGVLTDFLPHAYWIYDEVDYYIVGSEAACLRFIKEGIPKEKIKLLGIPIDPKFSFSLDKHKIAKKLNIDLGLPTILIMGGGQGIGPIKHIVSQLSKLHLLFQLVVVAGKNRKLLNWLKKKELYSHKKLTVFEYVNNIEELMEIATIIITKPGGLTTAEALAKGLPLIIVRPIPGQEKNNTEFILKKNSGIEIDEIKDINSQVESLLTDRNKLQQMQRFARNLGKPRSSLDIAELILNRHV